MKITDSVGRCCRVFLTFAIFVSIYSKGAALSDISTRNRQASIPRVLSSAQATSSSVQTTGFARITSNPIVFSSVQNPIPPAQFTTPPSTFIVATAAAETTPIPVPVVTPTPTQPEVARIAPTTAAAQPIAVAPAPAAPVQQNLQTCQSS